MVITVTLNPALDKTLSIGNFTLGTVNRVENIRYDIGGKGINVSKVLKNFDIDSVCTGFLGGVWESHFEKELKKRKIQTNFVHIAESTRTNTKVVDSIYKVYTDINEAGPNIDSEELKCFLEKFETLCNRGDIVVLSGGVSSSIPVDIYGTLIKLAKQKGAITVFDADGELLKHGLKEKPDIIKPNIHELQKLMGFDDEEESTVIKMAKQLIEGGVKKVLVSLGEKGAIYITEEGVVSCEGLKVNVKSTVGAGDSMVAALVYGLINNLKDKETLAFANACGAASVEMEGTEACSLEEVKKLVDKIKVSEL